METALLAYRRQRRRPYLAGRPKFLPGSKFTKGETDGKYKKQKSVSQ